jgi:uncharacterized NAD-dependent epimerase/dehydratase family protein
MELKTPYLLFLGDAPDPLSAKVAQGVKDWRPENVVGQLRLAGCQADVGAPDMTLEDGRDADARTLVIGVANRGGVISDKWIPTLRKAIQLGYDIAAGLHALLNDIPGLREAAALNGCNLIDVRVPKQKYPVGAGVKRTGRRVLPVGTDCACGKMYTALAVDKELRQRGVSATFRATGQTGIFIAGDGVPIDAVIADFISGAIEALAPAAADDHWDVIEGQGSLHHASFAGVTAGLIHGAQADALILCHEPTRTHMRGLPRFPLPDIGVAMAAAESMARLTNPRARFVGISVNTSRLSDDEAKIYLDSLRFKYGMPAVDPVRNSVAPIVDAMLA